MYHESDKEISKLVCYKSSIDSNKEQKYRVIEIIDVKSSIVNFST